MYKNIFLSTENLIPVTFLILLLLESCRIFVFLFCFKTQFHHVLFRIRNTYPASDLKTNTGKIWSVATKFPDHILDKIRFRISIWTDSSPSPLLLTQRGK